jgi:large subunit ribosomal protein L35
MPKMKTRRGAAKRFDLKKSGKIKRKRAKLRHILTTKSTKQKRRLRSGTYVSDADSKKIKALLAGG